MHICRRTTEYCAEVSHWTEQRIDIYKNTLKSEFYYGKLKICVLQEVLKLNLLDISPL